MSGTVYNRGDAAPVVLRVTTQAQDFNVVYQRDGSCTSDRCARQECIFLFEQELAISVELPVVFLADANNIKPLNFSWAIPAA